MAWNNAQRVGDNGLHKLGYSRFLVHSDRTHKIYSPRLKAFPYDCKLRGQRLDSPDDIDIALLSYLDDLCYVTKQASPQLRRRTPA